MSEKVSASKFTEARTKAILDIIRSGGTRTNACQIAGITDQTLRNWLADESRAEFREQFERAEAEAEQRMVIAVQRAAAGYERTTTRTVTSTVVKVRKVKNADGSTVEEPVPFQITTTETTTTKEFDWRAAIEWLRRRRHQEWGDRQRLEHSGPDGGPIQSRNDGLDYTKLSTEELKFLEAIYERNANPDPVAPGAPEP